MKTNNWFEMEILSMFTELEKMRNEIVYLMQSGELYTDKSKSLQVKSKEIMDRIIDCYYGEEHAAVHKSILQYAEHSTLPFQTVILWGLPIRSPDALFIKITILSYLMKSISWNGLCTINEVVMLKDNNNCYIDGAMTSFFMDAHQIPRIYIDKIDDLLSSDNKWLVYATCLFLSSWLGGGLPRGTDLKGFLLKFSHLAENKDPVIQQHLERINTKYSVLVRTNSFVRLNT